jgi:hypothetical protein
MPGNDSHSQPLSAHQDNHCSDRDSESFVPAGRRRGIGCRSCSIGEELFRKLPRTGMCLLLLEIELVIQTAWYSGENLVTDLQYQKCACDAGFLAVLAEDRLRRLRQITNCH